MHNWNVVHIVLARGKMNLILKSLYLINMCMNQILTHYQYILYIVHPRIKHIEILFFTDSKALSLLVNINGISLPHKPSRQYPF